jgi:hypothetical protein
MNCPLPAIGYLRGYLEQHRPGIFVTCAHWHQAIWKLVRPWVDERLLRGEPESYEEFFDAVFARLYLLEAEDPADAGALQFVQQYGSIYLDAQPLESFVALSDRIASFLRAEAQRLRLDTMDVVCAWMDISRTSLMRRQLIPALAFLRYLKRRHTTSGQRGQVGNLPPRATHHPRWFRHGSGRAADFDRLPLRRCRRLRRRRRDAAGDL